MDKIWDKIWDLWDLWDLWILWDELTPCDTVKEVKKSLKKGAEEALPWFTSNSMSAKST